MAKRFINTDIFNDTWFMDLPERYKLLWIYLITNCDHAGIWQVNFKTASFFIGSSLEQVECQRVFKGKFIKTADEKFWLLPSFLKFQYGANLNPNANVQKSVIETLKKYNLLDSFLKWTENQEITGDKEELPDSSPRVEDIYKNKDLLKNDINNLNINKSEDEKNLSPKSKVQSPKSESSEGESNKSLSPESDVQCPKSESSEVRKSGSAEESNNGSESINQSPTGQASNQPIIQSPKGQASNPSNKLLEWVCENAPRVNKLKRPLTEAECKKLLDDYDEKDLRGVLLDMENYKKLLSNYQSANLTIRKWLKIRESDLKNTSKFKKDNSLTPPPESPGGFKYFNPLTDKL